MPSCLCCKRSKATTSMMGDISKEMEALFYSHNGLSLVALIDIKGTILSYLANFCDNSVISREDKTIKDKVLSAITNAMLIKKQTNECSKIMGFDNSNNIFLKRATSTLIIYDVMPTVNLIFLFEMDSLDTLFFNPNKYITTNESTIVGIIKKFTEKPAK